MNFSREIIEWPQVTFEVQKSDEYLQAVTFEERVVLNGFLKLFNFFWPPFERKLKTFLQENEISLEIGQPVIVLDAKCPRETLGGTAIPERIKGVSVFKPTFAFFKEGFFEQFETMIAFLLPKEEGEEEETFLLNSVKNLFFYEIWTHELRHIVQQFAAQFQDGRFKLFKQNIFLAFLECILREFPFLLYEDIAKPYQFYRKVVDQGILQKTRKARLLFERDAILAGTLGSFIGWACNDPEVACPKIVEEVIWR